MARHAAQPAIPSTAKRRPNRRGGWRLVVAILLSLALAVVLFAAGFFACAAPPTTRILTGMTGQFEATPYAADQLVDAAVATRDFTVDLHMEGQQAATRHLADQIIDAAIESANPTSPKAAQWTGAMEWREMHAQRQAGELDTLAAMYELAAKGTAYALDEDAVNHLVDCNRLITSSLPVVAGCAIVALICIIILRRSRLLLGRALIAAPLVLLAAMLALGTWAAIDFIGFFSAFHGVLFPQGNWTFASDSLLICMLPQGFWMGMGAIWLTVTVLACIIAMLVGRRIVRTVRNARPDAVVRRASR